MTENIELTRREVDALQDLFTKFPSAERVALTSEQVGGIGSILTATIPYKANGVEGFFSTELTNQKDW